MLPLPRVKGAAASIPTPLTRRVSVALDGMTARIRTLCCILTVMSTGKVKWKE